MSAPFTDDKLRLVAKQIAAIKHRQTATYEPYEKQMDFHKLGATKRERMFFAANQCRPATAILTLATGERKQLGDLLGSYFTVKSICGKEEVWAEAGPLYRKAEPALCYRLYFSDGSFDDCAADHRMLTDVGWQSVERLVEFLPCLPGSIEESDLSVRDEDGLHSSEMLPGSRSDCPTASRFDDVPLLSDAGSAEGEAPSRHGARGSDPSCERRDDPASTATRSRPCRSPCLPSILDVQRRLVVPFVVSSAQDADTLARWLRRDIHSALHKPPASIAGVRSDLAVQAERVFSSQPRLVTAGKQLVAYRSIGRKTIYDFEVPEFHNYVTGGLVHHNSGKTLSAGHEVGYHATGLYPPWWTGRRFTGATTGWASGETWDSVRDNPQRILLGEGDQWGTGTIPKSKILEVKRGKLITGGIDKILVRHVLGGVSTIQFKAYQQGRRKWEGVTIHYIWFDEEPPLDIYTEGLARTNIYGGPVFITATPNLGMTQVVKLFWPRPKTDARAFVLMPLEECTFYSEAERRAIIEQYPEHERRARAEGKPMLGEGAIFNIDPKLYEVDPIDIPGIWPEIAGMDFGIVHPFGAIRLAWDRDNDCLYARAEYREAKKSPRDHASVLRRWGKKLPWAWPHDGRGAGGAKEPGKDLASLYEDEGLAMLPEHATHESGGFGLEASISDATDRMRGNRLKVFKSLPKLRGEISTYHRKNGLPVKEDEDLISALFKASMMRRFAETSVQYGVFPGSVDVGYDPLGHGMEPVSGSYDPLGGIE